MSEPRIAALVPMRHHSERVPGKNYRDFLGRPLYHHIVSTLLEVERVGVIVIDTDSDLIREECARVFPSVRLIERPEHLRDGAIPMNAVIEHDIDQVEADYYIQTHSTNPLLESSTITRAIDTFLACGSEADSLFGVTKWQTRLYAKDGRPLNHDPAVLLRTQDLEPVYEENSNLYLFSGDLLRRTGLRIGSRPYLFEIDRLESVDIDDEAGFRLAELLAHARNPLPESGEMERTQ